MLRVNHHFGRAMISSQRLDLIPLTPPFLRASLAGNVGAAARLLGAELPADWPEYPDVLALRLEQIEQEPAFQPWSLRAMVWRKKRVVVGHIGFHTMPGAEYLQAFAPGAVEFGFSVFPEFRRQGFGREAAAALMTWAHKVNGVNWFVLSIRPDNTASQALAFRLGFVKISSQIDDVDGPEDILELKVAPNHNLV